MAPPALEDTIWVAYVLEAAEEASPVSKASPVPEEAMRAASVSEATEEASLVPVATKEASPTH